MQTWQFAAVLVRFGAAGLAIQGVLGLLGVFGFLRGAGEVPAAVALGALFTLVFGVALWRTSEAIGRFFAQGLDGP